MNDVFYKLSIWIALTICGKRPCKEIESSLIYTNLKHPHRIYYVRSVGGLLCGNDFVKGLWIMD